MKRLAGYTAIILATFGVLYLLYLFRLVLFLFILSLFIAAALRPLVEVLTKRGVPRAAAQVLLYVVGIGGLLLIGLLISDAFLPELNTAVNRTVLAYERIHESWSEGAAWQQTLAQMLPMPFTFAADQSVLLDLLLPTFLRVSLGLTGFLASLLLVLAASVYWSVDEQRFERLWLSFVPAEARTFVRDTWHQIESAVGGYLRMQTVQSVLVGLLLGAGLWVMGFRYPVFAAVLGALAVIVPVLGVIVVTIVLSLLATLESLWLAMGVALFTIAVFGGLNLLLRRRFRTVEHLSLLLIFLLIIPLSQTFGVWGLIVTPPLAITLSILLRRSYLRFRSTVPQPEESSEFTALQSRYRDLEERLSTTPNGTISPELRDLASRLAELFDETKQQIDTAQ